MLIGAILGIVFSVALDVLGNFSQLNIGARVVMIYLPLVLSVIYLPSLIRDVAHLLTRLQRNHVPGPEEARPDSRAWKFRIFLFMLGATTVAIVIISSGVFSHVSFTVLLAIVYVPWIASGTLRLIDHLKKK